MNKMLKERKCKGESVFDGGIVLVGLPYGR